MTAKRQDDKREQVGLTNASNTLLRVLAHVAQHQSSETFSNAAFSNIKRAAYDP